MFRLDSSKALTLQITNDAFFYLKEDEDPLDDDNLEEALEVLSMFPNGFEIREDWRPVEDSDLIEATFIPYVQVDDDYDASDEMAKGYYFQIQLTQGNRFVKVWSFRESTGERTYKGEYELRYNSSKSCIGYATGDWRKGKGCLLWLKHYKERKPGILKNIPKDIPVGF